MPPSQTKIFRFPIVLNVPIILFRAYLVSVEGRAGGDRRPAGRPAGRRLVARGAVAGWRALLLNVEGRGDRRPSPVEGRGDRRPAGRPSPVETPTSDNR
jgi:hypothetical protein